MAGNNRQRQVKSRHAGPRSTEVGKWGEQINLPRLHRGTSQTALQKHWSRKDIDQAQQALEREALHLPACPLLPWKAIILTLLAFGQGKHKANSSRPPAKGVITRSLDATSTLIYTHTHPTPQTDLLGLKMWVFLKRESRGDYVRATFVQVVAEGEMIAACTAWAIQVHETFRILNRYN